MCMFEHLNIDERYEIQNGLNDKESFNAIGCRLGRDSRTIAREVSSHATVTESGQIGKCFNNCANRVDCTVTRLDEECTRKKRCSFCFKCCRKKCVDFVQEVCADLQKPPYCCNSCKKKSLCSLTKMIYKAVTADKEYRKSRSDANKGVYADDEELERINSIISPLIKNGQSIHHIHINHADEIMLSEKTLYSYVDKGLLGVNNLDLPRKVRYKPRKCNHKSFKIDKKCREGRTYDDMQTFIQEHDGVAAVEMDSVIGRQGGKVFLTIFFTVPHLMLAFIRDANTALSVKSVFSDIYSHLGRDLFMQLFPMIRTDNGSEFTDPAAIEFDSDGRRRTWVFYCDSYASWQKSGCELNHEFIRRVLPKGKSFDNLNQDDVWLMMNHINSYKRECLNKKSPYEMFVSVYGQEAADKLGLEFINPDEVILKSHLLKR